MVTLADYIEYGVIGSKDRIELIPVQQDEKDWQKGRAKYLGGSDAAAVLGLNPYSSPLQVYKSKVTGVIKDLSDKVSVRKGKDLEDWILQNKIAPRYPDHVLMKPTHMFQSIKYPFLVGNLDAIAKPKELGGKFKIIEIKYVTEYGALNYYKDEKYCNVPSYYWVQCQMYMFLTGIHECELNAFFESDWVLHTFNIPFDPEFIKTNVPLLINFWNNHIVAEIPPQLTPGIDNEEVIEALKEDIDLEPSVEFDALIEEYFKLNNTINQSKKVLEELKNRIILAHLQGDTHTDNSQYVESISTVTRSSFDTTKFAESYPDVYNRFTKESTSSRFQVRKKKK